MRTGTAVLPFNGGANYLNHVRVPVLITRGTAVPDYGTGLSAAGYI